MMRSQQCQLLVMAGLGLGIPLVPVDALLGSDGLYAQIPATPATTPAPSGSKGATFYDRYMLAGYEATNRRDHQTALLYFRRALDERPNDTYATQAIRNVEGYLGQTAQPVVGSPPVAVPSSSAAATPNRSVPRTVVTPATGTTAATGTAPKPTAQPVTKPTIVATPTTTPTAKPVAPAKPAIPSKLTPPKPLPTAPQPTVVVKPPAAVVVVPAAPTSDAFNEQQAIALINRWLQAKPDVFAPPFDQQPIVDLTTGELLASLIRPNGVLNWLKLNNAYFRYGVQKVDSIERFVVARNRATMEINLTEDRTLYLNGVIDPRRTDFSSQRIRFTFVADNGTWKIADYKTVDGSLLERSIVLPIQ